MPVDLSNELSFRNAFRFPLQSAASRREVLIGAALLVLLPGIGWLLNMGHRIRMVHRMQHGQSAWPSWNGWGELLKHGSITFFGMLYYYAPGLLAFAAGARFGSRVLLAIGALWIVAATIAIPGFMSHYCREFDAREIYDPFRALSRVRQGGASYWKAWSIALSALALSFLGLAFLGVGFLVTSVWFWQVAGFSFATVFTQRFDLASASAATAGQR